MAAVCKAFWIALAFCSGTACAAEREETDSDDVVIRHLERQVAQSAAVLGEQIAACEKIEQKGAVPTVTEDQLLEVNAEPADLVIAFAHLSFKNRFECEKEARLGLAYDMGALSAISQELGQDAATVDRVHHGLLYPPASRFRYQLEYREFSPAFRNYVEALVGKEPFDWLAAIEANGLTPR